MTLNLTMLILLAAFAWWYPREKTEKQMTEKEYRKHTGAYFTGKKGIANRDIRNRAGHIINAGETVIISGKNGRGGFNIMGEISSVSISRVHFSVIDFDFKS